MIERRGGSNDTTGTVSAGPINVYAGEEFSKFDQRAVAKIAFNYFACLTVGCSPQAVFEECFNELRDRKNGCYSVSWLLAVDAS